MNCQMKATEMVLNGIIENVRVLDLNTEQTLNDAWLLREAFKRKKQKYIGLLPIRGTPPLPPLARIGNFRFFSSAFFSMGVVIIGKTI